MPRSTDSSARLRLAKTESIKDGSHNKSSDEGPLDSRPPVGQAEYTVPQNATSMAAAVLAADSAVQHANNDDDGQRFRWSEQPMF